MRGYFNQSAQTVDFENGTSLPIKQTDNWPFEDNDVLVEGIHFHITQNNEYTRSTCINRYQVARIPLNRLNRQIIDKYNLPAAHLIAECEMN